MPGTKTRKYDAGVARTGTGESVGEDSLARMRAIDDLNQDLMIGGHDR